MMENLFGSGIYTVLEGARLLCVNPQRIRGWIAGYPRTDAPPILENEIGLSDDKLAFSFVNLMEIRFINFFSSQGVHVRSIRAMAEEAKDFLKHPHPFATETIFKTDGKKIFAQVAEKTGDRKLYDLKSKNWAFYKIIEQSLHEGVDYNPVGDILAWHPRNHIAPNVVINPKIAFGQPVLEDSGIPTEALFDAFNAEDETYESVAKWFEVPLERVKEAVRFQFELARTQ